MTARAKSPARVLVVDDELAMAQTIADGLAERGYDTRACASSTAAVTLLGSERFDALVTDLRMPGVDGLELLKVARKGDPGRPVIVMTAFSAIDTAIESIRQGAYHYLTKPFKVDELALFVDRALAEVALRREATELRNTLRARYSRDALVGESRAMQGVYDTIDRVADANVPVLIVGETGTGKGVVARAIHAQSTRAGGPFVVVNCAAIPEPLLESELFGHAKGAFTGATSARAGLFAAAEGGTILLDEIGEMSPALQAKLLDVLARGVVRAVGSEKERAVDARVVAATHRDLRERVRAGAFREDLFYRLDVVTIDLPALRHRKDDLPALIERFLGAAKAKHPGSPVERLAPDAIARLLAHSWPGNVRELEHLMERLVLLGRETAAGVADLPASIRTAAAQTGPLGDEIVPIREMQRRYATWALEKLGGHKTRTAEKLGVDLKTLAKWLSADKSDE